MVASLALGALNIFLFLFIVPKFEQIYFDALPGKVLPGLTVFVITARFALALLALAWMIAGSITFWQRHRAALWIIRLGVILFFALFPVTIFALFKPMLGLGIYMSDAASTDAISSH